jgi:hypothetical protein
VPDGNIKRRQSTTCGQGFAIPDRIAVGLGYAAQQNSPANRHHLFHDTEAFS